MKLEGKVAIVTAAGRGIGRGIALCLAEEGADVVVNSYREETTKAVAGEIEAMGRKTLAIAGDITTPDKIVQVVEDAVKTFGRIDILVNNVGGGAASPRKPGSGPLAQEVLAWDVTYEQNLRATVLMCEAVAPHFIERKSGKIITISSIAGRYGLPASDYAPAAYCSMKAGLIRYTQYLADRLGPSSINVNCVCPGIIYTDTWKRSSVLTVENRPEFKGMDPREWFLGISAGRYPELLAGFVTPLRREQTVEDIGRAVVFLVSDDAANITGQAFNVDGGMIKS